MGGLVLGTGPGHRNIQKMNHQSDSCPNGITSNSSQSNLTENLKHLQSHLAGFVLTNGSVENCVHENPGPTYLSQKIHL